MKLMSRKDADERSGRMKHKFYDSRCNSSNALTAVDSSWFKFDFYSIQPCTWLCIEFWAWTYSRIFRGDVASVFVFFLLFVLLLTLTLCCILTLVKFNLTPLLIYTLFWTLTNFNFHTRYILFSFSLYFTLLFLSFLHTLSFHGTNVKVRSDWWQIGLRWHGKMRMEMRRRHRERTRSRERKREKSMEYWRRQEGRIEKTKEDEWHFNSGYESWESSSSSSYSYSSFSSPSSLHLASDERGVLPPLSFTLYNWSKFYQRPSIAQGSLTLSFLFSFSFFLPLSLPSALVMAIVHRPRSNDGLVFLFAT